MSTYINSLKQWCEEVFTIYEENKPMERDNLQADKKDELHEQFVQFKESLTNEDSLDELEIYNRANELAEQLELKLKENGIPVQLTDKMRADNQNNMVPIGGHKLPPLPYSYNALEPYISQEIMRLHHDKHHQTYVDGLNKAEREMQKARITNNFQLIKHWEREAAFHGAGHYLHTIFWNIMSPDGGGKPSGNLLMEINRSFGSFDKFKKHFSEAANNVEGVGWAILVWSPRAHRLEILQAEKHQNLSQWDVIPLLVLDVWEHAYYLQYKNERKKYVDNWWKVVNWPEVEKRFDTAQRVTWQPF
ncbi:superoxide dismutase [Caldibacillus lycopersici]|uniref:superoxide dismutase n=1 Tax=Perspicuibacillus lycopersici TaxID=1325689 RepID=A0AAE3IXN1_9BACI|nr:superoxide dismutase [Perspicuibacillus lycopersici]MCU9614819.1 superoxide dismutase [Perspicuibacillus lycopersici]